MIETRAERTRTTLLDAFVGLIFRDGFERVSVQRIVAAAGTARSTFYEHFSSKEDVLRASMEHFFNVIADCVATGVQPPELTRVLAHFWENRRLVDATFSGSARVVLARSLSEMIESRMRVDNAGASLTVPYRLIAIQVAEAQLALIEGWLRGRAFARVEEVAAALHRSTRALALAVTRLGSAECTG